MPFIQVQLSPEEDAVLASAAKLSRRSKRDQLAFSALEHARSLVKSAEGPAVPSSDEAPAPQPTPTRGE